MNSHIDMNVTNLDFDHINIYNTRADAENTKKQK